MPRIKAHHPGSIQPISEPLRAGLTAIYRDLDAALADLGATCDGCGRCCHLAQWGHQMWLTNIELSLLLTEMDLRRPIQKGICPYLDSNGRCSARSVRALGCRIFHCQIPTIELEALYEQFLGRITDLAAAHSVELHYAELLDSLETLADFNSNPLRRDIP